MKRAQWEHLGLGCTLRRWQLHAAESLNAQIRSGRSKLCLIAPPGSGKTVCALAVALEQERFVEVRVPTTALVHQWNQRIREMLVEIGPSTLEIPFRITTYAAQTPFHPDALLIMDEAHHLTAKWGQWIESQWNPNRQILFGLTATPPYDAKGWDKFVDLFGTEPVQIPAPPLVRESQLSPFQDLVWPVLADLQDVPQLQSCLHQLVALEHNLGVSYLNWQNTMLREDYWALTEERFVNNSGLLVALCRLRIARGLELPMDILPEAEFIDHPTLEDRALAIWTYAHDRPDVLKQLKQIGFVFRKAGPVLKDDIAWKTLSQVDARVKGALTVLAMEDKVRGDDLRALIVCNRDVEGDFLSARQVLKALVSDPVTEKLEPILVSGRVFWVDEDIFGDVFVQLSNSQWVKKDHHYELDVQQWSTAERVALATKLLAQGVSRCIVGTRHLLGEGWDCPPVNCVLDLTGISASVTVNQIRGRGLRPDPNALDKVASLWDIISLAPGVPNGDRMLKQLRDRHQNTFGIDAQGRIRSGVERIDPIFGKRFHEVLAELIPLQQRMRERVENMADFSAYWAVGQSYLDQRVWTVTREPEQLMSPPQLTRHQIDTPVHVAGSRSIGVTLRRKRLVAMVVLASALASLPAIAFSTIQSAILSYGLPFGMGVPALYWLWNHSFNIDRDARIIVTLHAALRDINPNLGPLRRSENTWWVDTREDTESFALAVQMLLGPVRYPRYLLVEKSGRVYAVPEQLAAHKQTAEGFARRWAEKIGACHVVYARSQKGRELLRAVWRATGAVSQPLDVVEIWK